MEPTEEQLKQQLETNKVARHALATAHYLLCNQTKYMYEQFTEVNQAVTMLAGMCTDLQQRIEAVEPPPVKEEASPKKPYVMDVPTRG